MKSPDLNRQSYAARVTGKIAVLWQAFLESRKLATPLGILLAAISCAALWYFTEPQYRSSATLRIDEKPQSLAFPLGESRPGFVESQVELLRNSYIIGRAIESEGLSQLPELRQIAGTEDAVLWISQRLKVVRVGQSDMYEVSFSTRYPETAQKVVEAIVDTYMGFQSGETDLQRQDMLETLKDEVNRLGSEINNKRKHLKDIAQTAVGDDAVVMNLAGSEGGASVGRIALINSLQQKLVNLEVEIEVAKARVQALSPRERAGNPESDGDDAVDGDDVEIPEGYVTAALRRDPEIIALSRELTEKRKALEEAKERDAARIGEEIATKQKELEDRKAEFRAELIAEAETTVANQREKALRHATANLKSNIQFRSLLQQRIAVEREAQSEHGDKSLELKFARDELRSVENVHKHISDRIVHLRTEGRAPAQVRGLRKATFPTFPDGPTLAKPLAMIGIGVFFTPFLILIGRDLIHRRVFLREQLKRALDLKFVSEVPTLPDPPLLPWAERDYQLRAYLFDESVNALRTSLVSDEKLKDCRVLVVASAVSGEGKTSLASQLALSWMPAVQQKIILVDANLRAPNIHGMFDLKAGSGLAEVLRGECSLEGATVKDAGGGLFILPAGSIDASSPSHLFAGPRFRELLAQLRSQYDKVVIDVAPVVCASETLLIAKEADGVLFCARYAYSRLGQIQEAYDRLVASDIKIAAAVLYGIPARKYLNFHGGYAPV